MREAKMLSKSHKSRRVGKNGVVTSLGFSEGQTVTVVRVDDRTQIVSSEPMERLEEMVALISKPPQERHSALMQKLQGRSHYSSSTLPRTYTTLEQEAPLSETDAMRVAYRGQGRRHF